MDFPAKPLLDALSHRDHDDLERPLPDAIVDIYSFIHRGARLFSERDNFLFHHARNGRQPDMTGPDATIIYKITARTAWEEALETGFFAGSADDIRDGFIHFSTAEQVAETARKHFSGQSDLVLIAVNPAVLGMALQWEASRNGALFPHLYAPLPTDAALWLQEISTGPDGIPAVADALQAKER